MVKFLFAKEKMRVRSPLPAIFKWNMKMNSSCIDRIFSFPHFSFYYKMRMKRVILSGPKYFLSSGLAETGFEPVTSRLWALRATRLLYSAPLIDIINRMGTPNNHGYTIPIPDRDRGTFLLSQKTSITFFFFSYQLDFVIPGNKHAWAISRSMCPDNPKSR